MNHAPDSPAYGVTIESNARQAKRLSALLSPTRNSVPTGQRGRFFMAATDEVQSLRDADFLTAYGVDVRGLDGVTVNETEQ